MGAYSDAYARSLTDPEGFWGQAAQGVDWVRAPERVLDRSRPPFYRWFPDGVLNTCHNALDRHVDAGRGGRTALVHDSAVTGAVTTYTYAELRDEVARFAGALAGLGVVAGDRVVYLPMVPQAVVAMLACARIGAVHSVVFGGFAPAELAVRIDDARPRVVLSASCGVEGARVIEYKPLLDRALEMAEHRPEHVVVLQRPQARAAMQAGRDLDWDELAAAAAPAGCVPVAATDPLYVLYTSGTTGKPKGVVRDNGGHAVALTWSMPNVFGMGPDDVWFTASDVGWVVGHSYIVYAPLLLGATTVMYEGKPVGTPDAGAFWRVVEQHRVTGMFTAPTAIRAIRKEDPQGALLRARDTGSLRTLFLAGERLDPDTYAWATSALAVPVVDNWWQTETGWPIAANLRGLEPMPIKAGSPTVPVPGYDVRILDEHGREVPAGTDGSICIRLPLPPGTLPTLWQDDERYVASYLSAFEGHYLTGDGGSIDADGYLFVMGRTDDVINVAGHRLSTGSMEAVLATHPAVAECAVIGVPDELKGQHPYGLVVLKAGAQVEPDRLRAELVQLVRDRIGPVAAFKDVDVVPALPKTRSGKILRRSMRAIAEGRDEPVPSTIEDPAVLEALRGLIGARDPVVTGPGPVGPTTLVLMGVSGAGKSVVAEQVGALLGWPFLDADDLHPAANVAKMAAGHPLDDADRAPWLAAVAAWIGAQEAAGVDSVLACSALRRRYRDVLRDGHPSVLFAHLAPSADVLAARLVARHGHFMPASLLGSQLDVLEELEPDEPGVRMAVPAGWSVAETASRLVTLLDLRPDPAGQPTAMTVDEA